jgi:ketosteroid isomerase-like protein
MLDPPGVVEKLRAGVDAHDLDAIVDCFAADYRNETPAHPTRSFVGRDQVRRNWEQILGGVPDIRAEVVRQCVDGEVVWTEWDMQGTRRDGERHHMRGVIVFGMAEGRAAWARFYLEPVDPGTDGVDDAVRQVAGPAQR